jgi:C-terminal processing protease CtpA/Prc
MTQIEENALNTLPLNWQLLGAAIGILALSAVEVDADATNAFLDDIALAREALERIHPGYERYTAISELDALWQDLEQQAKEGLTQDEFYLGLSRMLAAIRCDHTKAELTDEMEAQRDEQPVYLPFTFRLFDDEQDQTRMYVDKSSDERLARGDEILLIDGDPVAERVAAVAEYVPVDGYTDHVKIHQMSRPGEFLGTDFEHFDALINPPDELVRLKVKKQDGSQLDLDADRLTWSQSQALTGKPRRRNFSDEDAVTVQFPAESVAVLNVNTFVNYRTPVKPKKVYRDVFAKIKERGTQTLIVDLRQNGGGSVDAQHSLIRWIINAPIAPVRDVRVKTIDLSGLVDHLSTWEPAALKLKASYFHELDDGWYSLKPRYGGAGDALKPVSQSFDGKVIVLTSAQNSSGAASFMGAMLESGRATLVGERTGGSQEGPTAGLIYFLTLPNSKIVVRVPAHLTLQAISNPEFGQGFNPDIEVNETVETWLAGRDPALERALALAAGSENAPHDALQGL